MWYFYSLISFVVKITYSEFHLLKQNYTAISSLINYIKPTLNFSTSIVSFLISLLPISLLVVSWLMINYNFLYICSLQSFTFPFDYFLLWPWIFSNMSNWIIIKNQHEIKKSPCRGHHHGTAIKAAVMLAFYVADDSRPAYSTFNSAPC